SSRRRHTRSKRGWSSDVCSSDLSYFSGEHHITSQREGGGEDDDGSVQVWKVRQDGTEGRVLLRRADEEGKLKRDAELTRDGGPQIGRASCRERVKISEVAEEVIV